ncbi:MAG: hypothetical protein KatS3mg025_1811 [Bacteroidia bacterium]|nr:MAG: hypothetical protein KatS3mg025_1811 [Bacteroidia bacterium]
MMLVEPVYIYMLVAFTGLSILLSLATFPLRPALGFWWAVMTIPLAAELFNIGTFTLVLPTDAFGLALGMITFFYTIFLQPGILQQLWQKVTLFRWIALYFLWMGIATLFSSDMLVSMKFWIAQGAYFIAFGLGAVVWLYNRKPSYTPLSLYKNALFWTAAIVLLFCIKNHIYLGLSKINIWVTRPFLRDHTVYGAYTSWFFIASLVFLLYSTSPVYLLLSILTGAGLILSYSRGGWLSALGALGLFGAVEGLRRLPPVLRVSFLGIGGGGLLVAIITLFQYNPQILEIYAYQSGGEIGKHLTSSFDIRENASNLERVNRWYAALQMFVERPIWGFGPNTFAQEYSAYQSSLTRTKISVEMGEVGGAHSEYLTAASEMGGPGLLLLIGIYLSSLITGLRSFLKARSRDKKAQYALLTFPLLTYYLHGFINNFMDHGHIAALVYLHWGLLMLLRLQEENLPSPHVPEKRLIPHL